VSFVQSLNLLMSSMRSLPSMPSWYKEAPIEWIAERSRRRGFWFSLHCFMISSASLLLGREWLCFSDVGRGFDNEQSRLWNLFPAILCALELACACLIRFSDLPVQVREFLVCLTYAAHLKPPSWIVATPCQDVLTTSVMWLCSLLGFAFSGVRVLPFFLCILADAVVLAYPAYQESWKYVPNLFTLFQLAACAAVVVLQQSRWRSLYDMEQLRNEQSESMEMLLSMLCDAKCWLDDDGRGILRSDSRLEAIFGQPMLSERLDHFLFSHDVERFRSAMVSSKPHGCSTPVTLITVMFSRADAMAVDAELFIVDRRGNCVPSKGTPTSGFLIGLRVCSLREAAMPMPTPVNQCSSWQGYCDCKSLMQEDDLDVELGNHTPMQAAESPDKVNEVGAALSQSDASQIAHGAFQQLSAESLGLLEIPKCGYSPDSHSIMAISPASRLAADCLPAPEIGVCSQVELELALADGEICDISCTRHLATLQQAVKLVCEQAEGGALVCIAEARSFEMVFGPRKSEKLDEAGPSLRIADGSYMTRRLRGIHISDPRFAEAFRDFTQHTESDRWPEIYPDAEARGRPKDGAFLISTSGYRLCCAAKLLGLRSPWCWDSRGTKHEAALACAWAVPGSCVLVRSDGGGTHFIHRHGNSLQVRRLEPTPTNSSSSRSSSVVAAPTESTIPEQSSACARLEIIV